MISRIVLIAAVLVLALAAFLLFGFTDNADLNEDGFGWGFLGLALFAGSFLPLDR